MSTEKSLKSHGGVKALFFVQIFSTLSFSVLYSTLVLYMTKRLFITDTMATTITASFVAFNYALHLIGGFISGRLLSHRSLFVIGMALQVVGCCIISFISLPSLYWGLAFYLSGSGLNVTCINCMLTQFFEPHEKRRETAFLWNYSGMNIGFFIGFLISGFFEISGNYRELFLLASASNFLTIIILLFFWKHLFDRKTHFAENTPSKRWLFRGFGFILILAIIISLKWLIKFSNLSNNVIIFAGIIMVFVISFIAIKQPTKKASKKIWAFLILGLMALVFFTLYTMAPMGLTLFIAHNVDRMIGGFIIPPQWVQNINTIIIIIGGPSTAYLYRMLRRRGINISIPIQFTLALFLIGIAFVLLTVGIHFANPQGYVHFYWIAISFILQSLGELLISPIGYAMIGQLVPHKSQGLLMGTWMMITGVAATIANIFSKMALGKTDAVNPLITNPHFTQTFNILGWGAIVAGMIMLFVIPFLHKLIKDKKRQTDTSAIPM